MHGLTLTRSARWAAGLGRLFGVALVLLVVAPRSAAFGSLAFTEISVAAGLDYSHGYVGPIEPEIRNAVSGVAVGDFNGDHWLDLYVVRGDIGPNLLFANLGDGTFAEVGAVAGVAITGELGSGPAFFDYDGDGWLDLFVGGIDGSKPHLFHNRGDSTFEEVTAAAGIQVAGNTVSAAFGDYDRDGDLDLVTSHWHTDAATEIGHIWRNRGDGTFEKVTDAEAGITGYESFDYTLSPNFVDYDGDGWPDLLNSGDFGTSKIFRNRGDGTFEDRTSAVITDENGMGSALADYDGDGDLDWFVSSVWDPDGFNGGAHWGLTGNRLYRNIGGGEFEDATDEAGVREGYWGWGSCFVDLDNDGVLDLFHVNGFRGPLAGEFLEDPSRLFMGNGDGTFTERSVELGIDDKNQGRGVVCFDYDRDGDIDLFVANNSQPPVFFRNELIENGDPAGEHHYLNLRLRGKPPNGEAIGARVRLSAGGVTQLREVNAKCSYVSHQPAEEHFGLGANTVIDEIEVTWPDGTVDRWFDLPVDQFLELAATETVEIPALSPTGLGFLAVALLIAAWWVLRRRLAR